MNESRPLTYYAAEKLREAQGSIFRGIEDLVSFRARLEKYRETNPKKAQECYLELKRTRVRLLTTLSEARLSLLEIEEHTLANIAGKLNEGLSGFDLMSRAYKPVQDALKSFAAKMPIEADTVSAEVIGRLMNNVRMGYYPTDLENISHIMHGITFPDGITVNLLDPCCGCGKALRDIAEGNNCITFGVELDEYRAEEAQSRLHRVGVGSFFHSRISSEAFHLMLLNPPYLSVMTEGGSRTRHEKRFLVESLGHLMIGGILIYVIPYYRLTPDICRILSDNFTELSVWRFTNREFSKFKQVAVIGVRKKRTEDQASTITLERLAYSPDSIPSVTELKAGRYVLPSVPKKVDLFKGERFNELELEQQLMRSDSIKRLMNAKSSLDSKDKRPLLPLSIGQIGLVGGSGIINGLVECATPHIIKGRVVKVKTESRDEKFSSRGIRTGAEIKEVISNKMIFNILTHEGFKSLT